MTAAGPSPVLYVHVADDGGILAIDGDTGRSAWVTEADLAARVDAVVAAGGSLLLSQERGSAAATPVIVALEASGATVVASPSVHPDAIRPDGVTALMSAAYLGATDLVRDLVARAAELETRDGMGYTALMYAANAGNDEIVSLLIDAGADVNATDRDGSTPLMFAAQHGSLTAVKRLLAAGADAAARRPADGLTARDFAAGGGHDRVAGILLSVEGRS